MIWLSEELEYIQVGISNQAEMPLLNAYQIAKII